MIFVNYSLTTNDYFNQIKGQSILNFLAEELW